MTEPAVAPVVLRLLDAPSPWWKRFIQAADPDTRSSLFICCKWLRDMVLEASSKVRLHRQVHEDLTGIATVASLQLLSACSSMGDVQVVIDARHCHEQSGPYDAELRMALWLANLCARMSAAPSMPLHNITYLEIQGVVMDELAPWTLVAACPSLRHIKHSRYKPWKNLAGVEPAIFPCHQIRALALDSCEPPLNMYSMSAASLFKKQLQALPYLQDVTLHASQLLHAVSVEPLKDFWDFGISGVHKQLTRFAVSQAEGIELIILPCMLDKGWSNLQCLHLPGWILHPASLEQWSRNMPQLTTLSVKSLPLYDGSAYSCVALTEMVPSLRHVFVEEISVGDLARVPFKGLQKFGFAVLSIEYSKLSSISEAMANLMLCSIVGASGKLLTIGPLTYNPQVLSLVGLIPLLRKLSFQELRLRCDMLLENGSAALFVQLPQLQVLQLDVVFTHEQQRQQLLPSVTALCVQARWPVTLRVHAYHANVWGDGWQQQVNDAMATAGHKHVTLDVIQ